MSPATQAVCRIEVATFLCFRIVSFRNTAERVSKVVSQGPPATLSDGFVLKKE